MPLGTNQFGSILNDASQLIACYRCSIQTHSIPFNRLPIPRLRIGFMSISPSWWRWAIDSRQLASFRFLSAPVNVVRFDTYPLGSSQFTSILCTSHRPYSIVHTSRLKVFQLSQTLRSDDWENSAAHLNSPPLPAPRLASDPLISSPCLVILLISIAHTPRLRVYFL